MSRLALYFLGAPRLELDGEAVSLSHHKALAMLAYLAVTQQPHTRQALANLLWPDYDPAASRGEVRRMLWVLNKSLGHSWLEIDREMVLLPPRPGLWLDIERFRKLLVVGHQHGHAVSEVCLACQEPLTEAVALARGDFLAGFTLSDSPDFDTWQGFETESLRRDLAGALERLVQLLSRQRDALSEQAVNYARRWLALDPLHEPAHRQLMQLYAWSGQPAAALRQYQACVQILKEELGVSPSPETIALFEDIKANRLPPPLLGLAAQQQEEVTSPAPQPPHNLPLQATSFIGREAMLESLQQRLADPEVRLMTIVGPGGIGKSRLALEAAFHQRQAFADGVYFVPLAPVGAAKFIAPTIAGAIGFSFSGPTDPQVQLLNYLREKRLLLVLDNLEHLLPPPYALSPQENGPGVEVIPRLLQQAPAIKLLVTSRERLNLHGEWVFEIQGLPVPPSDQAPDLEQYSAVLLFLQSAQRAKSDFVLSSEERPAVARICRLMEGLPLGIELAAAWVRLLSCQEIAYEIEHNPDFLTASARDVPARHHSIRAVFDHSWKLLSAEEQRVLRQLSVFRGGFQREAAARVAGAALPELAGLVDKSLVSLTVGGRYHLHELLRQFSADKLEAAPAEQEATRARHSDYFLGFLRERETGLAGKEQKIILDEIQAEVENVRAGWNWVLEQGQVEALDRALDSLYLFYLRRSYYQEGEETFKRTVEHLQQSAELRSPILEETVRGKLFMKTLARQGTFCRVRGRNDVARELLQKSLELARRWAVQTEIAFSLNFLGDIAWEQGDFVTAETLYQESLTVSEAAGHHPGMAEVLFRLGWLNATTKGAYFTAQNYLQQSLELFRELENQAGIALLLDRLGYTAFLLGDYSASEQYYRDGLALFQQFGDRLGIAMTIGGLGLAAWGRGGAGLSEAKQHFEESLAICREIGHQSNVQIRLELLGHVSNSLCRYNEARAYFQDAWDLAKQLGKQAEVSWIVAGLGEAALGLEDFQTARNYLLEALETTRLPVALEALVSWATLLNKEAGLRSVGDNTSVQPAGGVAMSQDFPADSEQKQQTVEILSLVLSHPATIQLYKDKAARLLAELAAELPPEVMDAAQERGQAETVEAVVAKIVGQIR